MMLGANKFTSTGMWLYVGMYAARSAFHNCFSQSIIIEVGSIITRAAS